MENERYWLWAKPENNREVWHEEPLTSFSLTSEEVEKIKIAASKDGWHSFRTVIDTNDVPDFSQTVNLD